MSVSPGVITEGESATVSFSVAGHGISLLQRFSVGGTNNPNTAKHANAYFDVTKTTASPTGGTDASFGGMGATRNRFSYESYLNGRTGAGTFTRANASGTVTITTADDVARTGHRTVTVGGDLTYDAGQQNQYWYSAAGDHAPQFHTATLTILDNEVPQIMLTPTSSSIAEGTSTTVTASVSPAVSGSELVITVGSAAGANTAAGDFTQTGTTLRIAVGATTSTGSVSIMANNDSIDGPNKSVALTATTTSNFYRPGSATVTITDNDMAALTVDQGGDGTTVSESGTTDTFTVALATEPNGNSVQVGVSTAVGEDECEVSVGQTDAGGNLVYLTAGTAGTLTFLPSGGTEDSSTQTAEWSTPQTVTVRGLDDSTADPNQTCTVTLDPSSPTPGRDATYHGLASSTVDVTVLDNEVAPTLAITAAGRTINESGANNSTTVTASLTPAPASTVTINLMFTPTSPATASDYSLSPSSNQQLTIVAGATSSTEVVRITAVDNTTDAPDKTVVVSGTASGPTGIQNPTNVSLTIADDDAAPTVSLSLSDASIAENGGTSQVSATLNRASSEDTTVTVTGVSGHYTVPSTLANRQITIDAGDTTSTDRVTITAVNNTRDEANRQERVAATAVNSQGLSNTPCTTATPPVCTVTGPQLTLEDDDTSPTVTLSVANATIMEASSTLSDRQTMVSAALTGGTIDVATTVTIANVAGAYTAPATANTITINAGATSGSGTVTITAVDDTRDEPGTVTVTGMARFAGNRGTPTVTGASLTITDDDAAPTVTLAVSPSSIAESGTGNTAQVSATLTGTTSSAATTVTVTDTGGGYTVPATANTITIAADQTSSSDRVTITAADNSADAADRTTTVTGTVANTHDGRTAGAATAASLTITDDDTAGLTVVHSDGATVVSEPQTTDSFTVALATLPTATVTVTASRPSDDSTECEVRVGAGAYGASATLTFTTTTWSTPQTVTVRALDDNIQDGDQACNIELDADSHATTGDANYRAAGVDTTANVTVRDNEVPTVRLSLSPDTISERGGTATVTASLSYGVSAATTVDVSAAAGTGAAAGDFRLSANRRLSFAPNATSSTGVVTIAAVDDRVDGPEDMEVTVSGTTSGGQGAGNPLSRTLTIEDDEAAPTVTLTPASAAIWEDGGTTTVSARLSHASVEATRVTVLPVAGVYTVAAAATITIPAGSLTGSSTVTITAVDNTARADADLTVTILHEDLENDHGVGELTAAQLTIWDDETASVSLSLEPARVAEGGTARVSARMDGNRPARAAVTLTVSAAAGTNATASSFALGPARTLTIAAGARTSGGSVEIEAVDDEVDAPDRMVTVTAAVGAGSRARQPAAVTLTIADDDETPRVILALAPAMIDESGETNAATVTATLERASSEATTVAVSASGTGFRQRGTELTIAAGATASAGSVTLTAVDDEERNEDREVRVSGRAANAHGVEQPAAVVLTIRDDDGTEAVTELLLPETARAMADSRARAVRQRLEGAASGAAAAELPTLTGLLERHGPSAQEEGLEWKKTLLPQASFALPLDGGDGGSGGITVWAGGDYTDLDGEARGVKWDGEVASAHAGADRLLANGLRLGLAASWSEAKFDYEHRNRQGEWKLEMGSAQPYLGWTTPGGGLLWASAGYGSGELEQDYGGGRRETAEADMRMAAAGARAPVRAADGLVVSLRGEAMYAKFEVDDNGGRIRGHESEASRLRLALEARRERVLASGAVLTPRFELGARHDGGDGETGTGAEVGAGVGYASGRLAAAVGARALVANADYDEWGADLSLAYAAGADGRGLAFRLAPSWGAARSGAEELWARGAPGLDGAAAAAPEPGARAEAELGYGLKSPLGRGLLTLAAGGEWGEDAGSACRLSGTVALDATASLGLELELRDPKSGGTERSLMLKAELKF